MDRPIDACCRHIPENRLQEAGELPGGHFPGRHREFAMAHRAETANMAVDLHVIGRIGKTQTRFALQQHVISRWLTRVRAQQLVVTQDP